MEGKQQFGWPDYLVFGLMLCVCMVIGVFFAWKTHKNRRNYKLRRGSEALNYLVGGRKMKIFPVAMSLVASLISGIGLLGTSTEIYLFGSGYMFLHIAMLLMALVMHFVFLPVYHELKLTSMYEYLERRFDKNVRLLGSVMFVIKTVRHIDIRRETFLFSIYFSSTQIIKIPIMIYVPALAFQQGRWTLVKCSVQTLNCFFFSHGSCNSRFNIGSLFDMHFLHFCGWSQGCKAFSVLL